MVRRVAAIGEYAGTSPGFLKESGFRLPQGIRTAHMSGKQNAGKTVREDRTVEVNFTRQQIIRSWHAKNAMIRQSLTNQPEGMDQNGARFVGWACMLASILM